MVTTFCRLTLHTISFSPAAPGRYVIELVPWPLTIWAPPATVQRKVRSLFCAAGTDAVKLFVPEATVALVVIVPAVSAESIATLAVGM